MARKCGNEFDKYLACGSDDGEEKDKDQESGGDNIGIAASGDVICCENRSIVEEYLQSRLVSRLLCFRDENDCNTSVMVSFSAATLVTVTVLSTLRNFVT